MEIVLAFARTNETICAERLLEDAGIRTQVLPLPAALRAGCGVCLRVSHTAYPRAAALLEQAGVKVVSVHTKTLVAQRSVYAPYTGGDVE